MAKWTDQEHRQPPWHRTWEVARAVDWWLVLSLIVLMVTVVWIIGKVVGHIQWVDSLARAG